VARTGRLSQAVTKSPRARLVVVSEQMKAWSAALAGELAEWPGVSCRSMFGFSAWYRGKRIFAVLPRTRGMGSANSLAFKLEKAGARTLTKLRNETRISTTVMQATRWFVFELDSDADLKVALDWLSRAYEAAR
jgi:hypothetical protein